MELECFQLPNSGLQLLRKRDEKSVNIFKKRFPEFRFYLSAHTIDVLKQGTEYVTSPDIPYLVSTQAKIAKETGCGFWNLFSAMGGLNSMPNM